MISSAQGGDFEKLSFLIVEDDSDSRLYLRHVLDDLGAARIYESGDGHTALDMLGQSARKIDVILCDWNMPSMSGIELLRHLRNVGIHTPFLIVTGRGDKDSVISAQAQGANGYIKKPFTQAQMEEKIRILLGRDKAQRFMS
ncbi:MAG: response regulator [Micavibrio sp.]